MASWSPISLWVFIWDFNTRRHTIVHGFCLFKQFLMGGKVLIDTHLVLVINHTPIVGCKYLQKLKSNKIGLHSLLKMGRYYNTTVRHYWDMLVK